MSLREYHVRMRRIKNEEYSEISNERNWELWWIKGLAMTIASKDQNIHYFLSSAVGKMGKTNYSPSENKMEPGCVCLTG